MSEAPQNTAPRFTVGQRVSVQTGSVRTPCLITALYEEVVENGLVKKGAQADLRFDKGSTSRRFLSSLQPL